MSVIHLAKDVAQVGEIGQWMSAGDSSETNGVRSFQVGVLGSTTAQIAVATIVRIYGANDTRFPELIAEVTVSGNATAALGVSQSVDSDFPYEFYAAQVVQLSGIGARVSAAMRV